MQIFPYAPGNGRSYKICFFLYLCNRFSVLLVFLKSLWSRDKIKIKISHKIVFLWLFFYELWKLDILKFFLSNFGVHWNHFTSTSQVISYHLPFPNFPGAIHVGVLCCLFTLMTLQPGIEALGVCWGHHCWCPHLSRYHCQLGWTLAGRPMFMSAQFTPGLPVALVPGAHLCTDVVLRKPLPQCGSICALRAPRRHLRVFLSF